MQNLIIIYIRGNFINFNDFNIYYQGHDPK